MVLAAPGKQLIDFGLRRAHGVEAGLMAARASYLAGFAGTATVLARKDFGIPVFGTMAHSFIQAHDDETSAFSAFAHSRPDNLVLLIDTYDTEAAARKVVKLAPRLKEAGIAVRGVRLDSGDMIALSRNVRRILDEGALVQFCETLTIQTSCCGSHPGLRANSVLVHRPHGSGSGNPMFLPDRRRDSPRK
jgi:nicotinate phosphoribosyltransferase